MDPLPNNTRYLLELDRHALLLQKFRFDEKYGTVSFALLTTLEALALLAYLYIAAVLIYYKKMRTKTNFIVSVWAIINFLVLLEKLSRTFGVVIEDDFLIKKEMASVFEMVASLGRFYGSLLSLVWVFSKYFGTLKPKYNIYMYFFMTIPVIVCFVYISYYFMINKYISEVYGPGCDIISAAVYILALLTFILYKIFINSNTETTAYTLMISLVNLVTNLPLCLITIYLRFNLDIMWTYRFHVYFVDFIIEALTCSAAFAVLFVLILFNSDVKNKIFVNKKNNNLESNTTE